MFPPRRELMFRTSAFLCASSLQLRHLKSLPDRTVFSELRLWHFLDVLYSTTKVRKPTPFTGGMNRSLNRGFIVKVLSGSARMWSGCSKAGIRLQTEIGEEVPASGDRAIRPIRGLVEL